MGIARSNIMRAIERRQMLFVSIFSLALVTSTTLMTTQARRYVAAARIAKYRSMSGGVEPLARTINSIEFARRVSKRLGFDVPVASYQAQSLRAADYVEITSGAKSPAEATEVVNAVVAETLRLEQESSKKSPRQLRDYIAELAESTEKRIKDLPDGHPELEALRGELREHRDVPASPVSAPETWLSVVQPTTCHSTVANTGGLLLAAMTFACLLSYLTLAICDSRVRRNGNR